MRNACFSSRGHIMASDEKSETKSTTSEEYVGYGGGIMCSVCFEPITEPVVFPCQHEICASCFHENLRAANFYCPICRLRISSWARKRVYDPVDKKRKKELASTMTENNAVDQSFPVFRRLAIPGEIHKDYMDEKKVFDKEREEEYNLGRAEALRLCQADHQAVVQQISQDEQVATELAKAIEQEDVRNLAARKEQEELDRSFAQELDQITNKQTTPTRIIKVKPSSKSRKKSLTTKKSKDTLPITIWLKPKVASTESKSSGSSSNSSIMPANQQIEKWQEN